MSHAGGKWWCTAVRQRTLAWFSAQAHLFFGVLFYSPEHILLVAFSAQEEVRWAAPTQRLRVFLRISPERIANIGTSPGTRREGFIVPVEDLIFERLVLAQPGTRREGLTDS